MGASSPMREQRNSVGIQRMPRNSNIGEVEENIEYKDGETGFDLLYSKSGNGALCRGVLGAECVGSHLTC